MKLSQFCCLARVLKLKLALNFNDTLQPAKFTICSSNGRFPCKIQSPVGEMISPYVLVESDFEAIKAKLSGMHEVSDECENSVKDFATLSQVISKVVATSICFSTENDCLKFASKTIAQEKTLLITLRVSESSTKITINTEAVVLGSVILKDVKKCISL